MNQSYQPLPNLICPLCGAANHCAPAAVGHFGVECWCAKAAINPEALAAIPLDSINKACLCLQCASLPWPK